MVVRKGRIKLTSSTQNLFLFLVRVRAPKAPKIIFDNAENMALEKRHVSMLKRWRQNLWFNSRWRTVNNKRDLNLA